MADKRPLEAADILFPPTYPPHYNIMDPMWEASYSWWKKEWTHWEEIAPRGGFIEDFILATKGTESAASFAVWTALTMVATVLARDAYLDLYPLSWYPNLYVILVAPPGVSKKSSALEFGEKVLRTYHEEILDENLRYKKQAKLHTNRVTPEGLQDLLAPPVAIPSRRKDVPDVVIDRGSQLSLFISELSTFLGRQSYNLGMVSKLTDLYGSKDFDADYTKKDGSQVLRNIYVNLLAATTPSDINDVIPQEAFGGGLMSRTIVVFERTGTREHPLPIKISQGPSFDDLKKGLAWIAANSFGPYTMSKEAVTYYYQWYPTFKAQLAATDSVRVLSRSRMDVLLMKLAVLIRAQRYEIGREVQLKDLMKAQQILEQTYHQNEEATQNVGATERGKHAIRVLEFIRDRREVNRRRLLQAMTRYLSSEDLTSIMEQLRESGDIDIVLDGRKQQQATRQGKEVYIYRKRSDDDDD